MSTNIFESARLTYRGVTSDDFDIMWALKCLVEQQIGGDGGDIIPKGEVDK